MAAACWSPCRKRSSRSLIDCQSFGLGIIYVSAQSLQRHAAIMSPIPARHITRQTPTALDANTLSAQSHRSRDSLLHSTLVGNAPLNLLGDTIRHQLGIQFGIGDFLDVNAHLFASFLFQLAAQRIDASTLATDDDARLGRMDGNRDLLRETLNLDLGNASLRQLCLNELADHQVFLKQTNIFRLFAIPSGLPVFDKSQSENYRVNFPTQRSPSFVLSNNPSRALEALW